MGKLKAWALEYGHMDEQDSGPDEAQFYAEVMAQQQQRELDADDCYQAWLDNMNSEFRLVTAVQSDQLSGE